MHRCVSPEGLDASSRTGLVERRVKRQTGLYSGDPTCDRDGGKLLDVVSSRLNPILFMKVTTEMLSISSVFCKGHYC